MMTSVKPTVGIVGTGLVGGSLGMCLSARTSYRVVGWDVSSESLDAAIQIGAVTSGATDLYSLCAESDVIIIATPISVALDLLPEVLASAGPDCVVTDVCSTKQKIMNQAVRFGASQFPSPVFVGGHPMAGSERQGIDAADPYLFENALYVLTPPESCCQDDPRARAAVSALSDLLSHTGARLALLSPQEHDFVAAIVSHLPHVVAVALVRTLESYRSDHPSVSAMAAGGFRDATRVAAGSPELWRDILLSNSSDVSEVIDTFVLELQQLNSLVKSGAEESLTACLARAAEVKRCLPQNLKGLTNPLYELVVAINDEPGKVSSVTSLIAAEDINIKDIEILKIREGEGGTLRLGFADLVSCQEAQVVLSAHGYEVRRR